MGVGVEQLVDDAVAEYRAAVLVRMPAHKDERPSASAVFSSSCGANLGLVAQEDRRVQGQLRALSDISSCRSTDALIPSLEI